jgi:hypothetical protein
VLAVLVNQQVRIPAGRKATVAALARLVPARCWETRSRAGLQGPPRL